MGEAKPAAGRAWAPVCFAAAAALLFLLSGCAAGGGDQSRLLVYTGSASASSRGSSAADTSLPSRREKAAGSPSGESARGETRQAGGGDSADASSAPGGASADGNAGKSPRGESAPARDGESAAEGASASHGGSSQNAASQGSIPSPVAQTDALALYNRAAAQAAAAGGLYYSYENNFKTAGAERNVSGYVRYAGRYASPVFLLKSDDGRIRSTVYSDAGGVLKQVVSGQSVMQAALPAGSAPSPIGTLLLPQARAGSLSACSAAGEGTGWRVSLAFSDCSGFSDVFALIDPEYVPGGGDCVRAAQMQCSISPEGWIEESEQNFDVSYQGKDLQLCVARTYHSPGAAVTVKKPDF